MLTKRLLPTARAALGVLLFSGFCHAQGIITTIAGGAKFQLTGIGGPATNVPLGTIRGVATDAQGNVYAADASNFIIVKIRTDGVLSVVAGNGISDYVGDGGLATNASLVGPTALAVDGVGNIFVLDNGVTQGLSTGVCAVRKIGADGIISTIAGGPGCGLAGDGGPAIAAKFSYAPQGIALDSNGNLYIADTGNGRIRKITAQGMISTVAGNGQCCYAGDGVQATSTALANPYGVAVDQNGVIYIADTFNDRIRRVGTNGIITTIAGGNDRGYSGDLGPAAAAQLNWPAAVALDGSGSIYIADMLNHRVRRITPNGIIGTIAGTGAAGYNGDEGPGPATALNTPSGVVVDGSGNVYIADSQNSRVRRIDPSGSITTYSGNGNFGFAGDGNQARDAVLNSPSGVVVDPSGSVYVSDTNNNRVRRIALNGTITTIAGGGAFTLFGNGDGAPATGVSLGSITGIAFDGKGNLYIAEGFPATIRRVSPDGTISTFYRAYYANALAVDAAGNVYVSQSGLQPSSGSSVMRISPDGVTISFLPARFTSPGKVAFDMHRNIYVPDAYTANVVALDPSGATKVVAGTGQYGFAGDGGFATEAQLAAPVAVALDPAGNLYIADSGNNRIRKVFMNPASGLYEPKLQTTLQPGYYTATVTLGQGEHPGYWGMEILAPVGVFSGGLNLGGTLQQRSLPPGFGGFFLPTPQTVRVHVDAQPAGGGDASNVKLGVQLLDAAKKPVNSEQFGGTSVDFTQPLEAGYYTITARGGDSSPLENFQMSVASPQLSGGVVVGGFAGVNTVGFAGFYLTNPQQLTIRMYGQPSYGADGAGGVRLTLYDANRNVLATVP